MQNYFQLIRVHKHIIHLFTINKYLFTVKFLLLCLKIYCFISLKNKRQFLRHLLGITKLDKEKNQCIRQKTGAQNIVKEIKQYQKK